MRRSTSSSVAVLLPLAVLLGCGTSQPPPPQAAAPAAVSPAAPAEKTEAPKPAAARPAKRERPATERAKVAQLFQVPQVTRANAGNYSDARQESGGTPQIRLLGFSRLDGQLRALVHVKGETLPVEQGDVIDGVEVVAIDADGVSFQYSGQRWTELLFEKLQSRPVVLARRASSPAVDNTPSDTSAPVELNNQTQTTVEQSPSTAN